MLSHTSEDTVQNCYTDLITPEAPGLSILVALPAPSLAIKAVLVSTRPSMAICSFHEPEQLGSVNGASSLQFQLSGTHYRFTFVPRPSVTVSSRAQDPSFLTFPKRTIVKIELNWTELNWAQQLRRWHRRSHTCCASALSLNILEKQHSSFSVSP